MRSVILAMGLTSLLLWGCSSDGDGGTGGSPGKTYPTEQLVDLPGFVESGPAPFGIAVDDTHVYVSIVDGNAETGSIIRIPKAGGEFESVVSGVGSSRTLAVVNGTIYFDDETGGRIRSVATTGGEVSDLTATTGATELTVSGDQVVFTNSVIEEPSLVGTVNITGGDVTQLFESNDRPTGIAVHAGTAYVALLGPGNATESDGRIVSVPLSGGTPEAVATVLNAPRSMVVEDDILYATLQGFEKSDGAVVAITLPSAPVKNLANWRKRPWGLATDATQIYWVNRGTGSGDGTVMKLAKDGGVPSVLADKQGEPRQLAVDASHVYWTNFNTGEVMKVAK